VTVRAVVSGWAALVLLVAAGGCFGESEVVRCTTADDCAAPFLCCTGGIATEVEGGPHCVIPDPSLSFCDGYLPHLVEGNPCARVPAAADASATVGAGITPPPAAADQCRAGLTCCTTSLTCAPEGRCPDLAEVPEGASSSGTRCHADDECSGPEICCGISYYERDGQCALVRDCPVPGGDGTTTTGGG